MRWSTKKRIEFIETRLFWEGKISRKDLIEYFDISIPQATKDIKAYTNIAPNNIQYDNSAKHYIACEEFNPALIVPESEVYLTRLLSSDFKSDYFFCGSMPSFYRIPCIQRKIVPSVLKYILKNIRKKSAIYIEYQSMSGHGSTWRWICPHAIGFDGFRWHTRAFCYKDKTYKDFNIGRILNTGKAQPNSLDHTNDFEWFNDISFKIIPHNKLTNGQRECIELDYGMIDGTLEFEVKAAFVFYMLKRLRLDKGHEKRPAKEQQIVLINGKEIFTQLQMLQKMSQKKIEEMESESKNIF